eukprot:m.31331 g.31331  ORF g.31331 m.31331 type:complete len:57 (+) comp10682_c0_seq4:2349-2519(+)
MNVSLWFDARFIVFSCDACGVGDQSLGCKENQGANRRGGTFSCGLHIRTCRCQVIP